MSASSIDIVPYDPDWPRLFSAERALLERVLAPWLSGGVHHIGSTSVPDLAAKPIIDMIAGVPDLELARPAIAALGTHSYAHAPHRPEALWFYKPPSEHWFDHRFHLHLTEPDSELWWERLTFRDALRRDPALRDEYASLKARVASERGSDIKAYTADKRAFVTRVLRASSSGDL